MARAIPNPALPVVPAQMASTQVIQADKAAWADQLTPPRLAPATAAITRQHTAGPEGPEDPGRSAAMPEPAVQEAVRQPLRPLPWLRGPRLRHLLQKADLAVLQLHRARAAPGDQAVRAARRRQRVPQQPETPLPRMSPRVQSVEAAARPLMPVGPGEPVAVRARPQVAVRTVAPSRSTAPSSAVQAAPATMAPAAAMARRQTPTTSSRGRRPEVFTLTSPPMAATAARPTATAIRLLAPPVLAATAPPRCPSTIRRLPRSTPLLPRKAEPVAFLIVAIMALPVQRTHSPM